MSIIKLGKDNRTIDTDLIKGGIRRDQLQTEELKTIWDAINTQKAKNANADNDVLDAKEILAFVGAIVEASGEDFKLGRRDMKSIKNQFDMEKLNKNDLFDFLEQVVALSEDIKESTVENDEEGNHIIKVVYKEAEEGTLTKTIKSDGTYTIASNPDENTTKTIYYDINNQREKDIEESEKVTTTTSYRIPNGENGELVREKMVSYDAETDTRATTNFNEYGIPADMLVEMGKTKKEEYKYVNVNGQMIPVKMLEVENHGLPTEAVTKYSYGQNGEVYTQRVEASTLGGQKVTQSLYVSNKLTEQSVTEGEDDAQVVTETKYDENEQKKVAQRFENSEYGGQKVTQFNYENGVLKTSISQEGEGRNLRINETKYSEGENVTESVTCIGDVEGERDIIQTFYKDGIRQDVEHNEAKQKEFLLTNYDASGNMVNSQFVKNKKLVSQVRYKDGNTIIVRQFNKGNETDSQICRRFGISGTDLRSANGGKINHGVGGDVAIPGIIKANDKRVQGRDFDKKVVKAKKEYYDAQVARDKALREQGLVNYQGAGKTIYAKSPDGKNIKCTIIGSMSHGNYMVSYDKGKMLIVDKDGNIQNPDRVACQDYYDANEKKNGVVIDNERRVKAPARLRTGTKLNSVNGHRDNLGRDYMIGSEGDLSVTLSRYDYGYSSNTVHVSGDLRYFSAHDAYMKQIKNGGPKVSVDCYKTPDIKFVGVEPGKGYFFNNDGYQLNSKDASKIIGSAIAVDANKASYGNYSIRLGIGTDEEALLKCTQGIFTQEIFDEVNAQLPSTWSDRHNVKDINGQVYSVKPYFNLLHNELSLDEISQHVSILNSNRAVSDDDVGTFTGFMLNDNFNDAENRVKVMNIAATEGQRLFLNQAYGVYSGYTGTGIDGNIRAGFSANGLTQQRADTDIAVSFGANRCYSSVDENGKIVISDANMQYLNSMQNRLVFCADKSDLGREAVAAGCYIVGYCPETYDYFLSHSAEVNSQKGYTPVIYGQDSGQIFLSNFAKGDDNNVDIDFLRGCNTIIWDPYTVGVMPSEISAQMDMAEMKQTGRSVNIYYNGANQDGYFDAVYDIARHEQYFVNKGVINQESMYKYLSEGNNTGAKVWAVLSGQVKLSDEEIAQLIIDRLKDSNDQKRAFIDECADVNDTKGPIPIIGDKIDKQRNYDDEIRMLASMNPEAAKLALSRIKDEDFPKNGHSDIFNNIYDATKERKLLNDAIQNSYSVRDAEHPIFYDSDGNEITDYEVIAQIQSANQERTNQYKLQVASFKRAHDIGRDKQNGINHFADDLIYFAGVGTDKGDVSFEYQKANFNLYLLGLADKGLLCTSDGNSISSEEITQMLSVKALEEINGDYETSIQYATMGIKAAPVIVVTLAATAAEAPILVIAGLAGATEYAMDRGSLEFSVMGNTEAARGRAIDDSVNIGLTTLAGFGAAKIIFGPGIAMTAEAETAQNFITKVVSRATTPVNNTLNGVFNVTSKAFEVLPNNGSALVSNLYRYGAMVSSDIGIGALSEYCMSGNVTTLGVMMSAVPSALGNVAALRGGARGVHTEGHESAGGYTSVGGKYSSENFELVKASLMKELEGGVTPARLAEIHEQINFLQSNPNGGARSQAVELRHMTEDMTGVYVDYGIDFHNEINIERIEAFKNEVSTWQNSPRREIAESWADLRLSELRSNPELQNVSTQSETLILNDINLIRETDAMLGHNERGRYFAIDEHQASRLNDRIKRTTDLDDLNYLESQLNKKKMNGGGKTEYYDQLQTAIDRQRLELRPEMTMEQFTARMEELADAKKGFSEIEAHDVARLIKNSSDEQFAQIKEIINKSNKKIKGNKQVQKAIKSRESNADASDNVRIHDEVEVQKSKTEAEEPHAAEEKPANEEPFEPDGERIAEPERVDSDEQAVVHETDKPRENEGRIMDEEPREQAGSENEGRLEDEVSERVDSENAGRVEEEASEPVDSEGIRRVDSDDDGHPVSEKKTDADTEDGVTVENDHGAEGVEKSKTTRRRNLSETVKKLPEKLRKIYDDISSEISSLKEYSVTKYNEIKEKIKTSFDNYAVVAESLLYKLETKIKELKNSETLANARQKINEKLNDAPESVRNLFEKLESQIDRVTNWTRVAYYKINEQLSGLNGMFKYLNDYLSDKLNSKFVPSPWDENFLNQARTIEVTPKEEFHNLIDNFNDLYKQTFSNNEYAMRQMNGRLEDLKHMIDMIEYTPANKVYLDEIKTKLSELCTANDYKNLFDVEALVDSINNINNAYHTIQSTYYYLPTSPYKISKFLRENGMTIQELGTPTGIAKFREFLCKDNIYVSNAEIIAVVSDFQMDVKWNRAKEYMAKNPDSPVSKQLYDDYLAQIKERYNVSDADMSLLRKIDDDYNTKVLISSNKAGMHECLVKVNEILNDWHTASKGQAELPPVLDFSTARADWFDARSAYGKGSAAAFNYPAYNNAQAYFSHDVNKIYTDMMHEITHSNDQVLQYKMIGPDTSVIIAAMPKSQPIFAKDGVKIIGYTSTLDDVKLGTYYHDMKAIGLTDSWLQYAYTNTHEFLACAGMADLSKCTPRLKKFLIDCGMPEWQFELSAYTKLGENKRWSAEEVSHLLAADSTNFSASLGIVYRMEGDKAIPIGQYYGILTDVSVRVIKSNVNPYGQGASDAAASSAAIQQHVTELHHGSVQHIRQDVSELGVRRGLDEYY